MDYYQEINKIDWKQLTNLYEKIGFLAGLDKEKEEVKIKNAFSNSYKIVTAWDNDKLVSAGRLISDGVYYGMIFDVGVLPEYQKKGIGKKIVSILIENNEHFCIHLTSTFGNEIFYKNFGFYPHKTAMAKYPHKSKYLNYE